MEVTLNHWEVAISGFVGVLRNSESMRRKLKEKAGGEYPFEIGVQGCAGEMAVAKYLNIYCRLGINTFKDPDVGVNLQVRTVSRPDGPLPIREGDKDDDIFVMLTGKIPTFKLIGWTTGAEGRKVGKLANPNNRTPAHFVDQKYLHPIETLSIQRNYGGIP